MADHATSADARVQRQLDRLGALGPGADILGLDRITRLLARVGDPHSRLPPVFHVAGTNGKGSTCAFLRGALEAAGLRVHVYSSPHLVRFNERIRLAGGLIDDSELAPLLEEVLDKGGDIGASFFEVTTTAAFLAFARTPADACVIEVGLGGRLDATNVVRPLITGIAQLGVDHQSFLGDTAEEIAGEKAGIAKSGVPLVTMDYPPSITARVAEVATAAGAPVLSFGRDWQAEITGGELRYSDAQGRLHLPLPSLAGPHQPFNLALATAMLRHQDRLTVPEAAIATAARSTRWPARMQRLGAGPLTSSLRTGQELWLDGGHNPAAAEALAVGLSQVAQGRPVHLIVGMLANKDAAGLLEPLTKVAASLVAVPTPGHAHHAPDMLADTARSLGIPAAETAPGVPEALERLTARVTEPAVIAVLGSLYLAGSVLAVNQELPD